MLPTYSKKKCWKWLAHDFSQNREPLWKQTSISSLSIFVKVKISWIIFVFAPIWSFILDYPIPFSSFWKRSSSFKLSLCIVLKPHSLILFWQVSLMFENKIFSEKISLFLWGLYRKSIRVFLQIFPRESTRKIES